MQLTNGDSTALVLVQDVNEAKRAAITIYRGTLGLGRGRRTRTRKTCTQSSGAGYNQGRQTSLARNAVK